MITFLAGLLAIPLVFWLLILIDCIVLTALVETENGVWATIVAIGSVVGLNFLWHSSILNAIKANPGHTAIAILSYFAIGAGWSIAKWYVFLTKARIKYESVKADFMEKVGAKTFDGETASKLMDKLEETNKYASDGTKVYSTPPQARKHKSNLTRWATYWPFSMVGFALNDVVRKAWQYVYDLLQSTYQRISDHVFRGATSDVAMAKEYKARAAAAGASTSSTDADSTRRGYNRGN